MLSVKLQVKSIKFKGKRIFVNKTNKLNFREKKKQKKETPTTITTGTATAINTYPESTYIYNYKRSVC